MGNFLKKGNADFEYARNGGYVDKSAMIQVINSTLKTKNLCSCVTRCRRFGKSLAAQMLYAYYDKWCDSRHLFEDLAIAKMPSFEEHLNKYPTVFVDMTAFTTRYKNSPDIVSIIEGSIKEEVLDTYPEIQVKDSYGLMEVLLKAAESTGERFIMIIDEWDAVCRENGCRAGVMENYVDWLRHLFKGGSTSQVFAGVYMTGILPIKKYNTQSALNNFREYSMVDPGALAPFLGFTEEEVRELAVGNNADIDQLKIWYDGYKLGDETSMFNPYSVMNAIERGKCRSYWQTTSAYDNVSTYIQMNFDGLKDDIIRMLAGESVRVATSKFQNDLNIIRSKDDVLTVLIHLGYLSYDYESETCRIPNKEVSDEFMNAVEDTSWTKLAETIKNSQDLLEATLCCDEKAVAYAIEKVHEENTSILQYNNENSLACILSIAYIYAMNDYVIHREFASGKGFADLVMIPRKNSRKPAIVIELKYGAAVETAIDQIRRKNYPSKLAEYAGEVILAGISYDRRTKTHTCQIERLIRTTHELPKTKPI